MSYMKLMIVATFIIIVLAGLIYFIMPGIWIPISIPFSSIMTIKTGAIKGFLLGFWSMLVLCMLFTFIVGINHHLMLPFFAIHSPTAINKLFYLSMNILVVGLIGGVSGLCGTILNMYLYKTGLN